MISFESGGRRLTGRLIGGEFIRYESRFPDGVRLPGGDARGLAHRGGPAGVAGRRPGQPGAAHFRPGPGRREAQTEGRARAIETVTASFHGDEPAIAFNPHYLLDGLTAAARPRQARPAAPRDRAGARRPARPTIRLEFTSPAKPALITWGRSRCRETAPAFRYLVVPLRSPTRA